MKKREIYLRAAEMLGTDHAYFSCDAIYFAAEAARLNRQACLALRRQYAVLFAPAEESEIDLDGTWGERWGYENAASDDYQWQAAGTCRILALCFMAAIVGDEEVK